MADQTIRDDELAAAEDWARTALDRTVPTHLVTLLAEYDRRGAELAAAHEVVRVGQRVEHGQLQKIAAAEAEVERLRQAAAAERGQCESTVADVITVIAEAGLGPAVCADEDPHLPTMVRDALAAARSPHLVVATCPHCEDGFTADDIADGDVTVTCSMCARAGRSLQSAAEVRTEWSVRGPQGNVWQLYPASEVRARQRLRLEGAGELVTREVRSTTGPWTAAPQPVEEATDVRSR